MNNFFNISRFCRLFVKHTAEHYHTYLMAVSVLAGVMLLGGSFLVYMVHDNLDTGFQSILFIALLMISGTIFTSTVFSDFGDKRKAVPVLTLPASHFEKYLVGWIYSYVIFLVIYCGIFYLVLYGMISLSHIPGHHMQLLTLFQDKVFPLFVLFSMLHAITIYGAILFEKLHFIKTAFCFFIVFAILIFFNTVFLRLLVGRDVFAALPYGVLNFIEKNNYYSVGADDKAGFWVLIMMMFITLLFWIATYFRLMEKQV
jgi:hypothetical protein